MSVVAASTAIPKTSDQHIVLSGISWDLYAELRLLPENRNKRMIYDQGILEIMTLSSFHERIVQLIARFIDEWTVARNIAIIGCGSMTFQHATLKRGLEPDRCYYVQHESGIRNQQRVDLVVDPPPDLVLEVDYTSGSLDKMAIYAAIGVPEVWHWSDEKLQIYALSKGEYKKRDTSYCLQEFPFELLIDALTQRHEFDETTLVRQFRTGIRNL